MHLNIIIPTWDLPRALKQKELLEETAAPNLDVSIVHSPDTSAVDNMAKGGELPGNILGFLHDDVTIEQKGWDVLVKEFFATHPECGMIGFGGATGIGTDDIYKAPYDYRQLARINFISNMVNAEDHGKRVLKPTRVAILDGFSQFIRREAYNDVGGWKAIRNMGITFHMYDFAMACLLQQKGWEIWMLPIKCMHNGGLTSTSKDYDKWLKSKGVNGDQVVHSLAHRICYQRFRNMLPLRLEEK